MKSIVFAGIAALALIGAEQSAGAADIPLKAAPVLSPYDWSGVYVGGNVGGGWANTTFSDAGLTSFVDATFSAMNLVSINGCVYCGVIPGVSAPTTTVNSSGWIGGIQAGWNQQFGRIVVGIEGEWDWSRLKGDSSTTALANASANNACIVIAGVPCIGPVTDAFSVNTKWIANATTRVGFAYDRLLVYSKFGVALSHNDYSQAAGGAFCPTGGCAIPPGGPFPFAVAGTASETRAGWIVGSGVEWGFANNWSAKIEYDYMNFGSKTLTFNNVALIGGAPPNTLPVVPAAFNVNIHQYVSELKFGINYRFRAL